MIGIVCKMLLGCREEVAAIGALIGGQLDATFRRITVILPSGVWGGSCVQVGDRVCCVYVCVYCLCWVCVCV